MRSFYDALETRPRAEREAALLAALPAQIAHAQRAAPAWGQLLAGVDAASVTTRAQLARLPVTRKPELLARQQAARAAGACGAQAAFGGFATSAFGPEMARVFASPGALYEPEASRRDYWRMARALHAAGFRRGELIHNSFSYHLVPAGAMLEGGAHALGCTVFPGGTGQTEQQLQALADLRPAGFTGTPGFLRILLEKAEQNAVALPFLSKALLSGEALPEALRDWFGARGVAAFQCYASADLGLIAYETGARSGLVLDEDLLLEIVRPGSGEPLPEGEVGEVVVTTLNPDYPLIRFGTGDLSAILPGPCPTGRSNTRITGWLGRADQSTKVRGMFVHPAQIGAIARRFPQLLRLRLIVSGTLADDRMLLQAETHDSAADLAAQLRAALRSATGLRAEVQLLAPGALPDDGKLIEDARSRP